MLLLVGLLALCHSSLAAEPLVDTPLGKVLGFETYSRDGRLYQAWTSIPYAQPPVGTLRLKAPKAMEKWEGILNATEPLKPCTQIGLDGKLGGQEDCLHLNVFRPKNTKRNLPVLAYVHGGAFQIGSAPGTEYADYIMDEDVILVVLHYRLGGLGFMSLDDTVVPGNFGMKDQVMALRWVKENIAAFGGNPGSITVFGGSAGAASTHLLLKSPSSEGIVSRAVSDSGSINKMWSLKKAEDVRQRTLTVAAALNCTQTSSEEILDCLQKADEASVMQAIAENNSNDPMLLAFTPVIEPEGSEQAFATENLAMRPSDKPWITSIANGEYLLFLYMFNAIPADQFEKMSKNMTEYLGNMLAPYVDSAKIPSSVRIIEETYFSSGSHGDLKMRLAKMSEAAWFYFPAIMNMIFHQGPKWLYYFEYPSMGQQVAPHASESVFYFKTKGADPLDPAGYEVSKRLIKRLVDFANYDDPTPKGSAVKWLQFKETEILRVTDQGDFMAERETVDALLKASNTWVSIVGWL